MKLFFFNLIRILILKFLRLAGDIRVYVEHQLKPVIEFKDTNPLQIKYFGFSSLGQSLARFFYDCDGEDVFLPSQLASRCQQVETIRSEHTQFNRIPDNLVDERNRNRDQYALELPLFVTSTSEAHILLASDNSLNNIRKGYEIG